MRKNRKYLIIAEILLFITMASILTCIYTMCVESSFYDILSVYVFFPVLFFILMTFLLAQLTVFEKEKFNLIIAIYRFILLIISVFLVVNVKNGVKIIENNIEYAERAERINMYIQESDYYVRYNDKNDVHIEVFEKNILNNHRPDTLFIDYSKKEISFLYDKYDFITYHLTKTKDNRKESTCHYWIQYKKSLESPGLELITYSDNDSLGKSTNKIELIMENGTHYYAYHVGYHNFNLEQATNSDL